MNAITSSIPELAPHIAKAKTDAGDSSVSSILLRADKMAYAQAVEEAKTAKLSSMQNRSETREIISERPTTAITAATTANQKARTQLSFMNQPASGEVITPRFGGPFAPLSKTPKEINIRDLTVISGNYSAP